MGLSPSPSRTSLLSAAPSADDYGSLHSTDDGGSTTPELRAPLRIKGLPETPQSSSVLPLTTPSALFDGESLGPLLSHALRPAAEMTPGAESESDAEGLLARHHQFQLGEADLTTGWSWQELRAQSYSLIVLGFPITIAAVVSGLNNTLTTTILGNMGTQELAAASLALLVASSTAVAPLMGLLMALETLCSQAYTGSSDPGMPGVYLQRCLLICTLVFTPIIVVWWHIHPIFLAMGQDAELAIMAARYLRYVVLMVVSEMVFEGMKKFYIAQGLTRQIAVIHCAGVISGLPLFYLLTIHPATSVGMVGVPLSITGAMVGAITMASLWLRRSERSLGWTGFTWKALQGWGQMARLAIPGCVMLTTELWALSLLGFAMAYFGPQALAAQAIAMTSLQFGMAAFQSIIVVIGSRVGNYLGLAMPNRARFITWSGLILGTVMASVAAVLLTVFAEQWAQLFNKDPKVRAIVSAMMPLLAFLLVCQTVSGIASGVLRGQGRPKVSAMANVICYYAVAVPLGLLLIKFTHLGLLGLWMAFLAAIFLSALFQVIVVLRSNWAVEVDKCRARLAPDSTPAGP
ncbi:ethionine resistance protein [Dimargaris verticillata]|uniref:Ethionine resistance protein n=1 Tax=Dimargaris verticillata TaxID=2761393 RepID=A0A9W8B8S8_9FUNG|nr:ethionine resistance protein [Dimargaris verticillata]